jgi:hypothetical protein
MANVEGLSSSSVPFGLNQPLRMLCVYDANDLPWSGPLLLRWVSFRADQNLNAGGIAAKQFIVLNLLMSTTARSAADVSTRFDENTGRDHVQVITNARVALPAQPPQAAGPRPCNVLLPFDVPAFFDLTPVRGPGERPRNLCVEMMVILQPAGGYDLDTPFVCSSNRTPFAAPGPRCRTSASATRQPLAIDSNDSVKAGGSLTYTVTEVPREAPFGVMFGTRNTGPWNGAPLPVDLTSLGAWDCFIATDWVHTSIGLADATGTGRVSYPVPAGIEFVGQSFYAQAICRDLTANPLLYVTSGGIRTTVCGPLGVARVYAVGNHLALTGTKTFGSAVIFEAGS